MGGGVGGTEKLSENLKLFLGMTDGSRPLTKKDCTDRGGAGGEMINLIDSHLYLKNNLTNHRCNSCRQSD